MNGLPIADVATFTPGRDALTNGLLLQMDCSYKWIVVQMDCSYKMIALPLPPFPPSSIPPPVSPSPPHTTPLRQKACALAWARVPLDRSLSKFPFLPLSKFPRNRALESSCVSCYASMSAINIPWRGRRPRCRQCSPRCGRLSGTRPWIWRCQGRNVFRIYPAGCNAPAMARMTMQHRKMQHTKIAAANKKVGSPKHPTFAIALWSPIVLLFHHCIVDVRAHVHTYPVQAIGYIHVVVYRIW